MANNRAYLCCRICAEDPGKTFEETCYFIMKYYPSAGWYVPSETVKKQDGEEVSRVSALNDWLETHVHGSMLGDYLTLVDESFDTTAVSKRAIVAAVAEALK